MAINEGSVRRIFSHLESGSGDRFFEHVAGDVDWTVEATHPLAGRYLSKDDFHTHTFARLNRSFPVALSFMSRVSSPMVIGAVVELRSYAVAKSGMRFDNRYCWMIRFEDEMIVEVRACLDSALVQKLIDENEK